ncbi:MAG TPA: CHAD domain-containing protein [Beijerinckiaceae bacterium]|nr:CHAD domain-containing protein [Beijerinckiaceae bacterium]
MDADFSPADLYLSSQSSLSWGEHVRDQLVATIRKVSHCFGASAQTPEEVHRARRLLKQANSLALLLGDVVGPASADAARALRGFRRELSDTRDFDVLIDSLARFAPSLEAGFVTILREKIENRRRIGAAQAIVARNFELGSELHRLSEEAERWRVDPNARADLVRAMKRSYAGARRRGARALASKLPADLHDLRKALIVHRAQREAFEVVWLKLVHAWCSEAQNLRDALGAFNDLSVLATFSSALEAPSAQGTLLLALIERAQRDILAQAEPMFSRLFCARPKDFANQMDTLLASPKKRPKAMADRVPGSTDVAPEHTSGSVS